MSETFALLHNRKPVDSDDPSYQSLLKDLQSNILSSHGKQKARYFAIRFQRRGGESLTPVGILTAKFMLSMLPKSAAERQLLYSAEGQERLKNEQLPELLRVARDEAQQTGGLFANDEELAAFAAIRVKSELDSLNHRKAVREGQCQDAGQFAVNLFLSARGYRALGLEPPSDPAFRDGMAARASVLEDSPHGEYNDVDALLVVAYGHVSNIEAVNRKDENSIQRLHEFLARVAEVVATETGEMLYASSGTKRWPIEPFGYRDNLSQPVFYQQHLEQLIAAGIEGAEGTRSWDPTAPLALVLEPDPHGKTKHACGSYIVFRKLQQNVEAFYKKAQTLRKDLSPIDAASQLVGREPDGTPLGSKSPTLNDFNLKDDNAGNVCPFSAHTRRSNPRGDVNEIYGARDHRIARRGMPYGASIERDHGVPVLEDGRIVPMDKDEPLDLGILFLCAQQDIAKQFEHIQAAWQNNPAFPPGRFPGPDPIAAAVGTANPELAPVRCLGGEYFYAPSISFLRGLLDDTWT